MNILSELRTLKEEVKRLVEENKKLPKDVEAIPPSSCVVYEYDPVYAIGRIYREVEENMLLIIKLQKQILSGDQYDEDY